MYSEKNNNNAANQINNRVSATQNTIQYGYWLQVYMIAVIICNLGLLFWDSNGSDTGFWEDWVKQLISKGYLDFNGNYPPIYIHWLYVVSKIYSHLQMPVENNILLKYLTQIPIVFSHLTLTGIIFSLAKSQRFSSVHFHTALLLTVLNPAIFFNGAIWGQIDIVPVIPVIFALLAGASNRYKIYTFPLYTLGLLTKFQMIAFVPAFGILFFTDYKTHLKAIVLCLIVFGLAFLPYMLTHNFVSAFKLAYVDVLHQYGTTTMGAANVWILLTGNAAPDSIILFGADTESVLAPLFTAKHFGMISFACVCVFVFYKGIRNLHENKYTHDPDLLLKDILFYAVITSMAFFTLLPAMHERYLLPAVIISIVCFATNPTKVIYPIAFTFISAFNLAMCLGIKTSTVWPAISWIMLAAFCYGIMELLFARAWTIFVKDLTAKLFAFRAFFVVFFVISNVIICSQLINATKIQKLQLNPHQVALTQFTIHYNRQDYGNLNINKSINGTVLTVAGKRFLDGLGTHANSQIDYMLPETAKELSFIVGLDDETESASVIFSIWGDEKLLWQSKPYYGAEKDLTPVVLQIKGIERLSLRASGINDISGDHADWIQPFITLSQ